MVEPRRGVLIPPLFALSVDDAARLINWATHAVGQPLRPWTDVDADLHARLRLWRDRHMDPSSQAMMRGD